MNKFFAGVLAVVMSLGMVTVSFDAEAKRVGGGKSSGMQRQATPQKAPDNTATPAQTPNAAAAGAAGAAGAAAKKSSWMGPLAGLAAGLGLAALASYLGFGEEFATMMMIALAVVVLLAVVGFIMRKRAVQQGGMAYAGATAGAGGGGFSAPVGQNTLTQRQGATPQGGSMIGAGIGGGGQSVAASVSQGHIPADFDVAGFVRNAKVNYIRLQAANDAGNLEDIRAFTTPEMFAEIKMDIVERAGKSQTTEVVQIDATVIDVAEETALYVVSVRFTGTVREDGEAVQVDEIWHLTKPRNGATGWVIAGIQQTQ